MEYSKIRAGVFILIYLLYGLSYFLNIYNPFEQFRFVASFLGLFLVLSLALLVILKNNFEFSIKLILAVFSECVPFMFSLFVVFGIIILFGFGFDLLYLVFPLSYFILRVDNFIVLKIKKLNRLFIFFGTASLFLSVLVAPFSMFFFSIFVMLLSIFFSPVLSDIVLNEIPKEMNVLKQT
jgi:hypothetical protein